MILPFYPSGALLSGRAHPVGQMLWTSVIGFTETWTVPDDVFLVSIMCAGMGEDASGLRTGNGGARRYRNFVPTTPGEPLTIHMAVNRNDTASGSAGGSYVRRANGKFLCRANAGTQGHDPTGNVPLAEGNGLQEGGWQGGLGVVIAAEQSRQGAGAGGFISRGQNAGTVDDQRGGQGLDPYGRRLAGGKAGSSDESVSRMGGNYGGGGGSQWFVSSGTTERRFGTRGDACVRIMWGAGRAFPNTLTEDM